MPSAPRLRFVIPRLAVILAAIGAALVPLPAAWVESIYSERAYLSLQRILTAVSNGVPFALFDVLLAAATGWLIFVLAGLVRRRKAGAMRALLATLLRLGTGAAIVYLAFLALWGLNYRRVPLTGRLAFAQERVTSSALTTLAHSAIRRANDLRDRGWAARPPGASRRSEPSGVSEAPQDPAWSDVPALLAPSFAAVQRQLAHVQPAVGGRPKPTLLTYYFERSGVDGMTDPFLLETLVNRSVLPFERPFLTAHEWAHLAGYADESEANFVGWLVCLQGPPAAEYSAQLALLWQILPELPHTAREAAVRELSPGVRTDLKAVAARLSRVTPVIRRVSWQVYDRYLKANRVEKGIESYGAALNLMLGTRFSSGWIPARH